MEEEEERGRGCDDEERRARARVSKAPGCLRKMAEPAQLCESATGWLVGCVSFQHTHTTHLGP